MKTAPLQTALAEAEANVEQIKRQIAKASCAEAGCDMRHVGGVNACCELERDCACSVPLHECSRCGDCDYGDNDEAAETRKHCAEMRDGPTKEERS